VDGCGKRQLDRRDHGVSVSGEILSLVNTINNMIGQLTVFRAKAKKVARGACTEGKLGGCAG